jgi:carbonic anhydrase
MAPLVLGLSVALADEPARHWGYEGAESPEHWGEFAQTCSVGQRQSPVELSTRGAITKGKPAHLGIAWKKVTGEAVDNGHTIQVNVPPGNFLTLGSDKYELQQFHFHAPSEHTVDGAQSPLEAHFVHKDAQGKLAVLGVRLRDGQGNAAYAPLFDALPPKGGTPTKVEVDLPAMLPKKRAYFAYQGSLTTPPCSEGVQWIVLRSEPQVSQVQLDAFRVRYEKNARPTQGWHGRTIKLVQ